MLENKKNEREKRAKEQPIDRTSKRKKKQKKKETKISVKQREDSHPFDTILAQFKYIYKKRKEWARV